LTGYSISRPIEAVSYEIRFFLREKQIGSNVDFLNIIIIKKSHINKKFMAIKAKVNQGKRRFDFDLNPRRVYQVFKIEAGKLHPQVTPMCDHFRGDAWPQVNPYNTEIDEDVDQYRAHCEVRRIRCAPGKHQPQLP
jgi:hypothetical protein